MKIVVETCPLCGGNDHELFETVEDADKSLTYQMCRTCGLVFQSPHADEAELKSFYDSGYRMTVQGSEEPTDKDLRIQAGRARHLIEVVRQHVPAVSRHLDLGSSSGSLLRAFKSAYGCESVGIEPGEIYRTRSQEFGIKIFAELSQLETSDQDPFDLVSIIHVLEHIPNPVEFLTDLRKRWMTPDAYLLIEVPNLFGHHSMELAHLLVFSRRTLRQTLNRAGFNLLRLFSHGRPRSPYLKLYLTALASIQQDGKFQRVGDFNSRGVRCRRTVGLWILNYFTERLPGLTWLPLPDREEFPED
jgi:2-polyprenyl-3-methyl-5-hydroxy-6-metoxy-1,4-benzoquinol methylase